MMGEGEKGMRERRRKRREVGGGIKKEGGSELKEDLRVRGVAESEGEL